jgi:hypothetical protein
MFSGLQKCNRQYSKNFALYQNQYLIQENKSIISKKKGRPGKGRPFAFLFIWIAAV